MTKINKGENIIKVENLVIAYGSFKAVNDISFDVKRGEIFGFLGANGAGKTTTIRTLCGILSPTAGRVFVRGRDVSGSIKELKPLIGYMSQKFTLYFDLSVKENLEFAGALYGLNAAAVKRRSRELMSFINFTGDVNLPAGALSGGTRQLCALCAALLHNPEIIFLDEPTAGVAPQVREDFWRLISYLSCEGKTIFVTTHYMDEAEKCHRIVLMDAGKIIAFDTPDNLKKSYFPLKVQELIFKDNLQEKIKNEINTLKLGQADIYGQTVRVFIEDKNAFEAYAKSRAGVFSVRQTLPDMEDVFLKAVARKGGL